MQIKPLIFDIARGSMADGDGIRTVIFLKGCPLHCQWCHNPESHCANMQFMWDAGKCIGCGNCLKQCSTNAISMKDKIFYNPSLCSFCGRCANACNALALRQVGKYYSPDELIDIVKEDSRYYTISGGGVTFSGGEPLLHMEYISNIAKILHAMDISVAIETSGYFDFARMEQSILPYVDTFFYDIKLMDCTLHEKYTGVKNDIILENFQRLIEKDVSVIPRTPLVPEITDTLENRLQIEAFLERYHRREQHVYLPFHNSGSQKYHMLLK